MKDKKLAYLSTRQMPSGGIMGAVLVCDGKGFPLEFRYTEPIVPTKIQKLLYGGNLEKYLKVDVILDSLLKVISSNYDMILVNDEVLLEYKDAKDIAKIAVVPNPILGGNDKIQITGDNECLIRIPLVENPIKIFFPKNCNCEGEQFDRITSTLISAGENLDILEPLARVQKSIDLICKREI